MQTHGNFIKIIKVKDALAPKVIEYVERVSYHTYSSEKRTNVERNAFKILKLEGTHEGTLIWLEGFGTMAENRYEFLKSFVTTLTELHDERVKNDL